MTKDACSGGNDSDPQLPRNPIELHWMQSSDIAMNTNTGVAVPALCGAWMQPDEALALEVAGGAEGAGTLDSVVVSCILCDLLYAAQVGPRSA